ncbi:multicopper oxidase domain-containing protein [Streptomyces olivaceus]|uniref:multicopper oxidase family protein n=1 Tax=Streptomyces olivaceus TaxID=47716 RepID=UPI001CCD6C10|nr:multicopper oxidase domain-containing protein [Streptomyces olivaceus]MBZ6170470.1 multicopper oxidase domain-containing protein [Streptomyces olivaceus]MBZ6178104.1 multicopper oxidase domain-containing protein [Streptomyces olivaceus]
MKRRTLFKALGFGVGGAVVLGSGGFGVYYATAKQDTVGEVSFDTPLSIPPTAAATRGASGSRVFRLGIRSGETRFKDGPATRTWGVNGTYLGPTVRVRRGEQVGFAVHNGLSEETSLHWHGMHLPAAMDGGPHQPVPAGGTWEPRWTVDQPAATLWYHPHVHGSTGTHMYRGLAGLLIVDDEETDALNLPSEYGVDDVPMIVQDRAFDGDNQFEERVPLGGSLGVIGDEILVNGTIGPYFDVTTRLVRLRLLNGSNARLYHFGFSDDRKFSLVATDGGLLAEPWQTERLYLSPGERAEIVVAFEPGERVELRSHPSEYGGTLGRLDGFDDRLDICQFRAAATLSDDTELPAVLGTAPALQGETVAEERSFVLASDQINGKSMAMDRIDFGVREGTVEVWEVSNDNGFLHNFHVHDVQFQVLTVDGERPQPPLRGWKDTVMLVQGKRYRLAMRFRDHTDPNVPYMYHCHLLQHEDDGMMGQFVVLDKGEQVGAVPHAHHHT